MLFIALLVGGSSVRGLPTTMIVQVITLLVVPLIMEWARPSGLPRRVSLLLVAILLLPVLQLLPVGGLFPGLAQQDPALGLPPALAWTMSWQRTAESLLFILPPALLFLALGRFDDSDFNRILPFFYLALLVNIIFAFVQFAARSAEELSPGLLPYVTSAGFFANQNHFATLMFVAIPLVIYQFAAIRRPLLSLVAVALIILACFATRSVAGAYLSAGCALFSYALILRLRTPTRLLLLLLVAVGMIALAFNPGNILEINEDNPLDRTGIWRTTWAAIVATWPFGAGLGTFDLVFTQFQPASDIRPQFINHAHNEYLELLLEGGVAAAVLLVLYLALLAWALFAMPRSPLRLAAFCGIVFMLLHSGVDYPLRTPALALVFAWLHAVLLSTKLRTAP